MVVGSIKTMIFGVYGMLGYELKNVFPNAKWIGSELNITDKSKVIHIIKSFNPDVVINAAAYTDVEECENNIEQAFCVNGWALSHIAEVCYKINSKLIHFSTDYVFDGTKKEYGESSVPNPINVYGKSKLLGELSIREHMEDFRIVRTSWLYGPNGKNFVNTILKLSTKIDTVSVVNDQFGKPTYTVDLSEKIKEIINLEPGVYHITNEGSCSWYDFACAIIQNAVPIKSEEFITKAKRPKCSVLLNTKTKPMRHWKDALREYLSHLK